jgi:hypothetical protein
MSDDMNDLKINFVETEKGYFVITLTEKKVGGQNNCLFFEKHIAGPLRLISTLGNFTIPLLKHHLARVQAFCAVSPEIFGSMNNFLS